MLPHAGFAHLHVTFPRYGHPTLGSERYKYLTELRFAEVYLNLSYHTLVVESLSVLNRAAVPGRPGIFGREP